MPIFFPSNSCGLGSVGEIMAGTGRALLHMRAGLGWLEGGDRRAAALSPGPAACSLIPPECAARLPSPL